MELENLSSSYAIFPKRDALYANLQPCNITNISQINTLKNAVGYIGYECYDQVENIVKPATSAFCNMPQMHFSTFEKKINFSTSSLEIKTIPKVGWIESNFTKNEYLQSVEKIINYIKKGTCYQVNLTRKFFGEFESKPNPLDIFAKLYSISPNPYSMLYVFGNGKAIISSSPECFLTRNKNEIYSVPIKGSIKVSEHIKNLYNAKDKSENLMITDLVRNDLSRISNKVWVGNFQQTETFSQVHHMSSKVCGKLYDNITNADCINATFPAGSMTGAPKIKAIETANELEKMQRGVYSGCLGVVDDFENFDFSVVIRTIILDGNKFEFQVGGGIVYDSSAEEEFEETITKAMPILDTIRIKRNVFENR